MKKSAAPSTAVSPLPSVGLAEENVLLQPSPASKVEIIAVLMAVSAMCSVQFGTAMSAPVMEMFGSVTTTWLRLCIAALILAVVVRPSVMRYTQQHWIAAVGLGAAMACMTFCFFAAIAHVPLGLAVAIEFLGPLCVAAVGLRKGWGLLWPLLAATGILFIARQNNSWTANALGLTLAAGAALGWAGYILLMKRVGSLFKGMEGLSSALIVAALLATPFGLIESGGHVPLEQLFYVSFLALLVPLVPYVLELNALRRMTTSAFGILMSLEPAIGVLAGFVILQQPMSALQCLGTLLVVTASVGALRSPKRLADISTKR